MISSYRLGDVVLLPVDENTKTELELEHPNSIGAKYLLKKKRDERSNIDIITEIVLEHDVSMLPSDVSESTVIHLRLGDVVAGNEWHEKLKRPFNANHIKSLLMNETNKKYVIGKCFFAKPSSTNYEECIQQSNAYLQDVIAKLGADHFDSGNADIDLCCAVRAKVFVQGRGYFSKLIVEIRKKLGLTTIETSVHD